MSKETRIRVVKEEILEAEKFGQSGRLCQLYALLHKEQSKPRRTESDE